MKNKLRLYLAYWRRQESELNPGRYHVGLLLSPKDPKNTDDEAIIYHAINPIDKEAQKQVWKFEDKKSKARTSKLAGVMLLGKISRSISTERITAMLATVNVPTPEEANKTGWRCRHWVLDAIDLLADGNILPPLPSSAQDLWKLGFDFVESKTRETEGRSNPTVRVPTCDLSGQEIRGELGPLA
ncbi:hypothetical protein CVT26_002575 [Gymnopilus dilepis]|uniref:Uncharacterized protein n=1 Tax=Gymnopilus dilepis TaxID=231916 RepID=A0A409VF27_9AGAR|nr:hypothetical protein CVT26_002575 [Gymnopilus dilepis]